MTSAKAISKGKIAQLRKIPIPLVRPSLSTEFYERRKRGAIVEMVLRKITIYLQALGTPVTTRMVGQPPTRTPETTMPSIVRKIIIYLQVLNMPRTSQSDFKRHGDAS